MYTTDNILSNPIFPFQGDRYFKVSMERDGSQLTDPKPYMQMRFNFNTVDDMESYYNKSSGVSVAWMDLSSINRYILQFSLNNQQQTENAKFDLSFYINGNRKNIVYIKGQIS